MHAARTGLQTIAVMAAAAAIGLTSPLAASADAGTTSSTPSATVAPTTAAEGTVSTPATLPPTPEPTTSAAGTGTEGAGTVSEPPTPEPTTPAAGTGTEDVTVVPSSVETTDAAAPTSVETTDAVPTAVPAGSGGAGASGDPARTAWVTGAGSLGAALLGFGAFGLLRRRNARV